MLLFSSHLAMLAIKSFLPVEAEISVFITANMNNSKSHCKQEVDVR